MQVTFTISSHGRGARFFLTHGLPSLLRGKQKHGLFDFSVNVAIIGHGWSKPDLEAVSDMLERNKVSHAVEKLHTEWRDKAYADTVTGVDRRLWPCQLYPYSDIYVYLEDDMLFHEDGWAQYLAAARFLRDNQKFGVVYHTGHMGIGSCTPGVAYPYDGTLAWSGRGLTFRNIEKVIDDSSFQFYVWRSIPGKICFEDKAVIYSLPRFGYGIARMFGSNTRHFTADSKIPPQYHEMLKHKLGNNYRTIPNDEYINAADHDFFRKIFDLRPFDGFMPRAADQVKRLRFTEGYKKLLASANSR